MKQWNLRLTAACLAFALCAGCSGSGTSTIGSGGGSSDDVIELSFGHIQNPGHDLYIAPEKFKQQVEERTGGRVIVTLYPSSQLGTAREMMEQCAMGTLDITFASSSEWSTALAVPEWGAFELPFLYNDLESQKQLIDQVVVDVCEEALQGTGLMHLMTYSNSLRHAIIKDKPIDTLEDIRGLKMRCPETAMYVDTWNYLGANTVTAPWSEVYTVLSQGVADAAEPDVVGMVSANLQEVCGYLSKMGQMGAIYLTFVNEDKWNTIPAELREIILECAHESETEQIANRKAADDEAEQIMADAGVIINDVEETELSRMREAVLPVYENYAAQYDLQELIDRLLAFAQ